MKRGRRPDPQLHERNEAIATAYADGEPRDSLAQRFGVTPRYVGQIANRLGAKRPAGAPQSGPRDPARALDMARRYASGRETLEQIGASYGVTKERARQIINAVEKRAGFSAHAARRRLRDARRATREAEREARREARRLAAPTVEQRFMAFVRKDGDCWIWAGSAIGNYPRFRDGPRKKDLPHGGYAHRWAVLRWHDIDSLEGLDVVHLCPNTRCVNPAHLEAVSAAERVARCENHPSKKLAFSADYIADLLRLVALDLGGTPTSTVFQDHTGISWATVAAHLGGEHRRWSAACETVGLTPEPHAPLPTGFYELHAHLQREYAA